MIIEVNGLTKTYGLLRQRVAALDDVSFSVPEGGVYGFLGPNGAGKTTTFRCLLGLARPTRGDVRVLGQDVPSNLHAVVGRIGTLIESPGLFPNFSGERNLQILAKINGISSARVKSCLEQVGLSSVAHRAARTYSQGMKQRLSLAAALLKETELLILDEPATGLDPRGISEIRELIRTLGKSQTVLLSSHLLGEVQEVCNNVAIISQGRIVAAGKLDDVLHQSSTGSAIVVSNPKLAASVLTGAAISFEAKGSEFILPVNTDIQRVTKLLIAADVTISEIRPLKAGLEELFLKLTEGGDEVSPQ